MQSKIQKCKPNAAICASADRRSAKARLAIGILLFVSTVLGSTANLNAGLIYPDALQGGSPNTTAYLRLDTTFNGIGIRAENLSWLASDMALQPDGKIVGVASVGVGIGDYDFALIRYNPDGSLDTSFDGDGRVVTPIGLRDFVEGVAIQGDGKIVAVGHSDGDFAIVRYNGDGSLDTSFDGDGKATVDFLERDQAMAVSVQADGKILVAGIAGTPHPDRWAIARLNSDGTLDASFSGDGKATNQTGSSTTVAYSLAIQPDGKAVVAGRVHTSESRFALARYNTDGSMDASFGNGGLVTTSVTGFADEAHAVAIQADGKIVAAGRSHSEGLIVRYNADGSLDTSFGAGGKVVTTHSLSSSTQFFSVVVKPNGKILAGGTTFFIYQENVAAKTKLALAQYNTDGSLDRSFDRDGQATLNLDVAMPPGQSAGLGFTSLALDSQGRVTAFGSITGRSPTVLRAMLGPEVPLPVLFDRSGDGRADLSVFRPSNNIWYTQSHEGFSLRQFGQAGDRLVPADFDGDGLSDTAVFRPSTGQWFFVGSADRTFNVVGPWGQTGDIPAASDATGDGRADFVLYRPSNNTWYTRTITFGDTTTFFGGSVGVPQVGDFDNDGVDDLATYRPADHTWRIRRSSGGLFTDTWGAEGDIPAAADYDGDGATDIAIWRPSTGQWYIIGSTAGWIIRTWGVPADIPVPADYDADGKADLAIFRPSTGTWYIVFSATGNYYVRQFGQDGDVPIPSAFVY